MNSLHFPILLFCLIQSIAGNIVRTDNKEKVQLLLLHHNDLHARFDQISEFTGKYTLKKQAEGLCNGGLARVSSIVNEARKAAESKEGPAVLYLNAGDIRHGSSWDDIYEWKMAADLVNAVQPDAVSLSHDDADEDPSTLEFLKAIKTDVVSSNVAVDSWKNNENLKKSKIMDVNSVKIGLVGFLKPERYILSSCIEYVDEVIALKEEVSKLKDSGVNFIIALGYTDYNTNIEIAKEVEGLDVIISGNADGKTILTKSNSGRDVLLIKSQNYDSYLGHTLIEFDQDGDLVNYSDDPVLLDSAIPQDVEIGNIIQKYTKTIQTRSDVVGTTSVVLDGDSCSTAECNYGNLIADAIIYVNALSFEGDQPWTDASIAMVPSGFISGSIAPDNRPATVFSADLTSTLPESNNIVAITFTGEQLLQVLELSVSEYSINNPSAGFLQYSGIRVVYDLSRESGSRIVTALARCSSCYVPEFYTIDSWRTYRVLMPATLAQGGYGVYSMLADLPRETLSTDEVTMLSRYIEQRSPVYPEVAGRITLLNVPEEETPTSETGSATAIASTFTVVMVTVLNAVILF